MDYHRIYNQLIKRAVDRSWKRSTAPCYIERHHIIPKCIGGSNKKQNLVCLSAREHFIAHILLAKIYNNHKGLVFAAVCMMYNKDSKINCRKYQQLRHQNSIISSERHKGIAKTADARLKMSLAKKGKMYGENNNFYGKTHTDEFKKAQSERKKISQQGSNNTNAKLWKIIFPDGTINIIKCLRDLCKQLNCSVYKIRNNKVPGYIFCGEVL